MGHLFSTNSDSIVPYTSTFLDYNINLFEVAPNCDTNLGAVLKDHDSHWIGDYSKLEKIPPKPWPEGVCIPYVESHVNYFSRLGMMFKKGHCKQLISEDDMLDELGKLYGLKIYGWGQ